MSFEISSNLSNPGMRLAKALALCGVASRRQAEILILKGLVCVNGKIQNTVTTFVDLNNDCIVVDGKRVEPVELLRVWLYYKPIGVVTTQKDPQNRPTVFDALKQKKLPHVISVGRLDLNSEGLLLITNKGSFAHFAESPKTGWKRTYKVRVFGDRLSIKTIKDLSKGITIDGVHYKGIEVDFLHDHRAQGRNYWILMTLTEGKNREIRKVLNYFGLHVNRLIRLTYGPFTLSDLKPGDIQEVPLQHLKDLPQF